MGSLPVRSCSPISWHHAGEGVRRPTAVDRLAAGAAAQRTMVPRVDADALTSAVLPHVLPRADAVAPVAGRPGNVRRRGGRPPAWRTGARPGWTLAAADGACGGRDRADVSAGRRAGDCRAPARLRCRADVVGAD